MAMESYRQHRQYRNPLQLTEYWGTTAPSASTDIGPYNVGDIVWNTSPAALGYIGWVCVTAGANGSTAVFKGFGSIAA